MNRRNVIIGSFIVAAISLLYVRAQTTDSTPQIEENAPLVSKETESKLEAVLGRAIPEDVEKVTLIDLTESGMTAIATRAEDKGVVEFNVLADLEESEDAYQVWAGSSTSTLKQLGVLSPAKGGYLFEYRKSGSLEDHKNVEVKLGEQKVLEGSF